MLNKKELESRFRWRFGKNAKITSEGIVRFCNEDCAYYLSFEIIFYNLFSDEREQNEALVLTSNKYEGNQIVVEWESLYDPEPTANFDFIYKNFNYLEEKTQKIIKKYNITEKS